MTKIIKTIWCLVLCALYMYMYERMFISRTKCSSIRKILDYVSDNYQKFNFVLAMHSSKAMLANTVSYKGTILADTIIQLALLKGETHEVMFLTLYRKNKVEQRRYKLLNFIRSIGRVVKDLRFTI